MIPIMILYGFVTGYWWRQSLISSALVWPVILVVSSPQLVTPDFSGLLTILWASLIGLINAVVGMIVIQLLAFPIKRLIGVWQSKRGVQ